MKVKDYLETHKLLKAADCMASNNSGTLDVTKIKNFIDNIDKLKANCEAIIEVFENKPFTDAKVVIDKEGKVYLTSSYKLKVPLEKPDDEVGYEGVNVMGLDGSLRTLPIGDVAPYNDQTKILYGKK